MPRTTRSRRRNLRRKRKGRVRVSDPVLEEQAFKVSKLIAFMSNRVQNRMYLHLRFKFCENSEGDSDHLADLDHDIYDSYIEVSKHAKRDTIEAKKEGYKWQTLFFVNKNEDGKIVISTNQLRLIISFIFDIIIENSNLEMGLEVEDMVDGCVNNWIEFYDIIVENLPDEFNNANNSIAYDDSID